MQVLWGYSENRPPRGEGLSVDPSPETSSAREVDVGSQG